MIQIEESRNTVYEVIREMTDTTPQIFERYV